MNPYQFEFTTHYLAEMAFNCFTNKYFELCGPINKYSKDQNSNEKLVSLFQDNASSNKLYVNQVFEPGSKCSMEFDCTKMTIWKEYFCRYDEGKKDKNQLSQQLQLAEESLTKTISIQ